MGRRWRTRAWAYLCACPWAVVPVRPGTLGTVCNSWQRCCPRGAAWCSAAAPWACDSQTLGDQSPQAHSTAKTQRLTDRRQIFTGCTMNSRTCFITVPKVQVGKFHMENNFRTKNNCFLSTRFFLINLRKNTTSLPGEIVHRGFLRNKNNHMKQQLTYRFDQV